MCLHSRWCQCPCRRLCRRRREGARDALRALPPALLRYCLKFLHHEDLKTTLVALTAVNRHFYQLVHDPDHKYRLLLGLPLNQLPHHTLCLHPDTTSIDELIGMSGIVRRLHVTDLVLRSSPQHTPVVWQQTRRLRGQLRAHLDAGVRPEAARTLRHCITHNPGGVIEALQGLRSLVVEDSIVACRDSGWMSQLTALQHLQVYPTAYHRFQMPPLRLPRLQSLSLRGCCLAGIDDSLLRQLPALRQLDLRGCLRLTCSPARFAALTMLSALTISDCTGFPVDVAALHALRGLRVLHMAWCTQVSMARGLGDHLLSLDITGCTQGSMDDHAFRHLTSLHTLKMNHCNQTSISSAAFRHTPLLRELHMRHCTQRTIGNAAFSHLPLLTRLSMEACVQPTITTAAFRHLRHLKMLNMRDCPQCIFQTPPDVVCIRALTQLAISSTSVPFGLDRFKQALPHLQQLQVKFQ